MINIDELKGYLAIDKAALDEELMAQPQLFYSISEALTEAMDERDALKAQLALVEAELDEKIRTRADASDERITNDAVKAQVTSDTRRQKAYSEFAKAKKQADKLSALKEAFIQRSHMLKHLCELYVANYYEQNSVRGTSRQDTVVYNQQRKRVAELYRNKR